MRAKNHPTNPFFQPALLSASLLMLCGLVIIALTANGPLNDFGNYYYGSRLLLNGRFTAEMYSSIHYFNSQIAALGGHNFFENYIPVPPFSAIFYVPFCFLPPLSAKLLFNLLSLAIFCFSLYRLLRAYAFDTRLVLLLPLVALQPLYHNLLQGQSYLLVFALLSEAFIASEKGKVQLPAILLALCISLKLFPVFVLLYFILRKNNRVAGFTLLYCCAFILVTLLFMEPGIVGNYYARVAPRLAGGDVVGSGYQANHGFYGLFMRLFSFDALSNPQPFLNLPFLVPLCEALLAALFLAVLLKARQANALLLFGLTLMAMTLTGRYYTWYGAILLLFICMGVLSASENKMPLLLTAAMLFLAFALPGTLGYLRLPFLAAAFVICAWLCNVKPSPKTVLLLFVPLVLLKLPGFSAAPPNYFSIQHSRGLLYDLALETDSIRLSSTLGEKNFTEALPLRGKARFDEELKAEDGYIIYKGKRLQTSGNKLKPFIYNDTCIVFMSDAGQGVGFYTLHWAKLP